MSKQIKMLRVFHESLNGWVWGHSVCNRFSLVLLIKTGIVFA